MRWWLVGALALAGCGGGDEPETMDSGDEVVDSGDEAAPDSGPPPLPACGTGSPEARMACVERARWEADLETIAGARPPGSAHHEAVRELCASRLASLGFEVEHHDYGTGVNVVGARAGTSRPDERVLVSAHYDSTPGCPGADDDASGVAGALEVARVLAETDHARTLVAACWDEEERGLIGSEAWAERAAATDTTLVANFVFEMIGYADDTPDSQSLPPGFELLFPRQVRRIEARGMRGDFLAVVADERHSAANAADLEAMGERVGLRIVPLVVSDGLLDSPATGDLRRSDHAPFWARDQPGMMLTDTANFRNPRYHCTGGQDTVASLDPTFATRVVQVTVGAAARALNP
ncbi:MAG TPA: M20/M25/M40 family metallo-hydrolase [Sandaracinaceae bacterium LLY-WYZ-13_1]|nr:M20/M25/M40 family metallo-hydrolase [Sandaracinaceae bacterium LLY-WYZ-13_1]